VGWSLAFVGLISASVQAGLIRVIIPYTGPRKSLFIGLTLYMLGNFLFAFATQGWMMFAFSMVYCLGGLTMPSFQGIISTQVPANEQGELQGALTSLMSLASVIGPNVMAQLFYMYSNKGASFYFPGAPLLAGGILTLISMVIVVLVFSKDRKRTAGG
jgi:DHA1 family tetracycline resistance protein-like MFS transporter